MELVSNASAQLFPDNTLSSFTNFSPEKLNHDGQSEVAISEITYPSLYWNVTEGKIMFFEKTFSKSAEFYYLEPGFYPSITDIFEAMNILIQERHNHNENCIKVKRKKLRFTLQMKNSVLHFLVRIWDTFSRSNVVTEFGVMLRRKGPHKPEFAYDIIRIHSLMIYIELIEYNIVGNTKAPLLLCFPFISKLNSGDIITTEQYMNYQTFSNLQFIPMLKSSFHTIHIDLRDTSGKKTTFCIFRYHSSCFDVQKSLQHSFLI